MQCNKHWTWWGYCETYQGGQLFSRACMHVYVCVCEWVQQEQQQRMTARTNEAKAEVSVGRKGSEILRWCSALLCVCVNCMQTKNKEHAEQSEAHKKRVHKKCKGNEKLVELVAYFGAQPRQRQRQKARGQTGRRQRRRLRRLRLRAWRWWTNRIASVGQTGGHFSSSRGSSTGARPCLNGLHFFF